MNFRKFVAAILVLSVLFFSTSFAEARSVRVKGSYTKKGTYRQSHHRTSPNKTKRDNWSTKGNMNPYTGKGGTKNASN